MPKNKRVMFIGDLHLRHSNPDMRIDSYLEELNNLILQSFVIAEEECDAVVLLGDIFHEHEVNAQVRNETIDLLRTNPKTGEPWGFELYAIMGNHDLKYHNPEMLDHTALGTLNRMGLNIVDSIPEYSIFCGHYQRKIEHVDFSDRQERIYAMHAYILPAPEAGMNERDYVNLDHYSVGENCELVIIGHYHSGYDIIKREDGVQFACPGALSRAEATKSNIERPIRVAIATIGSKIKLEYRDLEYTPGNEIFDIERMTQKKIVTKDKKELASRLTQMRNEYMHISGDDPLKAFREFTNEMDLSEGARDVAMEVIQEVMLDRDSD